MQTLSRILCLSLCLSLFCLTACTQVDRSVAASGSSSTTPAVADSSAVQADEELTGYLPNERSIRESEKRRAACFHLQPAGSLVNKGNVCLGGAVIKAKKGQKNTKTKTAQTKGSQTGSWGQARVCTGGLCQPQSLIYARCRSGIATCRLGNTSPVQWFACAKSQHNTSATPLAGSVIVLDVNARRGMPTGHPAYVEAVTKNSDGTCTLRISHTNYDRKCHLDLNATVIFDPKHMTASFMSGPWAPWAKGLKALGFIVR